MHALPSESTDSVPAKATSRAASFRFAHVVARLFEKLFGGTSAGDVVLQEDDDRLVVEGIHDPVGKGHAVVDADRCEIEGAFRVVVRRALDLDEVLDVLNDTRYETPEDRDGDVDRQTRGVSRRLQR